MKQSRPGVDAQTDQDGGKCADEPFHAIPNGGPDLCSRRANRLAIAEGAHEADCNQNNGNASPDGGRIEWIATKRITTPKATVNAEIA
jgi:hypothetical protein